MARRLDASDYARRIHARGFTYEDISVALGRGKRGSSFVQKVGTGKKEGGSLLGGLRHLDRLLGRRKQPAARPLPSVAAEAPRREQRLRQPERVPLGRQRLYFATSRPSTGKFHAYLTLQQRLARAARDGMCVRLTTNWKEGQWIDGPIAGPVHAGQQWTLWNDGIMAAEALDEIERTGYNHAPEGALAALVREESTESDRYLRVNRFSSYSLQVMPCGDLRAAAGGDWS
jgi:hypothetical protein